MDKRTCDECGGSKMIKVVVDFNPSFKYAKTTDEISVESMFYSTKDIPCPYCR